MNSGTKPVSRNTVKVYLSNGGTPSGAVVLYQNVSVAACGVKKVLVNANLPMNASYSGKYLIAIVDQRNSVAETDETNNVVTFGPM